MTSIRKEPLLTPEFVRNALRQTQAPPLADAQLPFTQVTTDSRKVVPGCLFVALKGDQFDGHDFIPQAIAQGARGIVSRKGFPISFQNQSLCKNLCLFEVEDSLDGFRKIATAWRQALKLPVIAVAGSAGKTTTKELLAAILRGKWTHVLKTQGSQNGFVGIPITLLGLSSEHQAAVIEVGIDEIGAMKQHMELVSPTASVVTSIGPEHLENLHDIPTVAQEEGIALSHVADTGGSVVINLDDPWIKPFALLQNTGRKITFSLQPYEETASVRGTLSADGKTLTFSGTGLHPTSVQMPLPGKHNASNLMAAISVAVALGLNPEQIIQGLAQFKGAEGRSQIRELPGSIVIICDYYNASPMSMKAGLELLAQTAHGSKPTWACLADMLELGPDEGRFHRELAHQILELKIQNVLLYGPRMLELRDELVKRGFNGYQAHFSSHAEMGKVLIERVKKGDTILIKGSRGMKMEEVWKLLESQWRAPLESKNSTPHS